ncbi:hypothetical protein CBR_g20202 [Chara braunii]|uniref:BED-type domain-containing protein n=1 Tax=Chara braunii TaxID=69332 RepID=A0A388KZW4_CHABU|nr:hypothetical protein CBR_g20202 [Chara braunii]|eukprot:GBG75571.1 hypothetical protein CBR_g20202 [Chara braunii]
MLRCTFCNKVFQGTQFYTTKHFTQQYYCKKVSDDALYQIAQKCTHRFEADQVQRVRRFVHERGLDVPRSGAMGGKAERPAQGVGEGEDTEHYAEGGVARYGEGAGAAEEDEADVDLEVGVAEGERTPRGEGGVPKSDLTAHQRAVDWERKCGKKAVPPETTCTPSSSKSAVPDRASTPGSSKRKEGGAQLSGTSAGKRLRQQKMTDTYGGEWISEWRMAFFRRVYSSGIALNAFRNTPYRDLQQVAFRQPGGVPLPVLPSHSEIADMRTVEIHHEQLAEELEEVRQPLWTPAPTTTREQTSIPATQSGPSSPLPLSGHSIPGFLASALPVPVWHDERSPAPVGREDLGSSLRIHGHGSLFSVARPLVLDPRASSNLGEMGVHSGAPPVEEKERRAEEHGAAGAGGVEGIRGMEEEVAGVVGGVVEVDDGVHAGREEAMAMVDDGEQVEGVEGVLPSEVEREDDVVRTQEAMMRDDEGEEAVAGVDESVAGVDDGAAQVEMEEDVVRADAAALVGGEEGVVGGDVAHGTGEGGGDLDPIVQRFVDDEMGPALAG